MNSWASNADRGEFWLTMAVEDPFESESAPPIEMRLLCSPSERPSLECKVTWWLMLFNEISFSLTA